MTAHVRVRFAPSPTGNLHIGSLRSALFNWLFAKHNNGVFLLRIEDTDLERSKPEYTTAILDAFSWVNITSDEPLVIQSEQIDYHKKLAEQLLREGKAYYCYCTPEEVAARQAVRLGQVVDYILYDGFCKNKSARSEPGAIRFALDSTTDISFNDLICGPITFARDQLDDFIIVRSDGRPMYNFAVVADDARARITHIIRGEEHLSNTPKQILLYQALGFPVPQFAHLPLILGSSGQKLSKRDAATSVVDYKKMGYLPDALVNYLVRLGWSHGDQEIFSRQELIDFFSLEHVGRKGAIFDVAKLNWVNGVYIRSSSEQLLLQRIMTDVNPAFLTEVAHFSEQQLLAAITLYKERMATLRELADEIMLLHTGFSGTIDKPDEVTRKIVSAFLARSEEIPDGEYTHANLALVAKTVCAEHNLKLVALALPIRLALIGKTASPGVFDLMAILGKKTSATRIRAYIA